MIKPRDPLPRSQSLNSLVDFEFRTIECFYIVSFALDYLKET